MPLLERWIEKETPAVRSAAERVTGKFAAAFLRTIQAVKRSINLQDLARYLEHKDAGGALRYLDIQRRLVAAGQGRGIAAHEDCMVDAVRAAFAAGANAAVTELQKVPIKKFDPDQPRDEAGRWTDTGSATAGGLAGAYPLAANGALPKARGADWNGLNKHRETLRRRAEEDGEDIDGLISRQSLDEMHRIANDSAFLTRFPETVYFGLSGGKFGTGGKFENLKTGYEFAALGMRSTTPDLARARAYASDGGNVFRVELPVGTRAVKFDILGIAETTLLPGSKFEVIGTGGDVVRLKLLSDGTDYVKDLYNFRNEIDSIVNRHTRKASAPVKKFDPDQPRDEAGRWTDTGGSSEGNAGAFGVIRPPSMTGAETRAVQEYKYGKLSSISDKFRSGKPLTPEEKSLTGDLDHLLERQSLPALRVFRIVTQDLDFQPGKVFEEKGYLGTTLKERQHLEMSRATLVIRVPKGSPGAYIEGVHPMFPDAPGGEREVLFARGARLEVEKVRHVTMYGIPKAATVVWATLRAAPQTSLVRKAAKKPPAIDTVGFEMRFDLQSPEAVNFVRNYTFSLLREVGQDTQDAVKQIILNAFQRGITPAEQARAIRDSIGLTQSQSQAVSNFMRALSGGPAELRQALTRELRDRRFDPTLRQAIEDQVVLSPDQIQNMTGRYYERYLDYRSETIARTETLRAANAGQQEAWSQAVGEGLLDRDTTRQYWLVAEDDRLCEACAEVPDLNSDGVELDKEFDTSEGPLDGPPLHPNCRCTVVLEFA